jgi:acyl-coenzyme A thioesterase PaaI-like protein
MSFATRLARRLRLRLINLYPPYLGAGIRVTEIAPDFRSVRVRMRLGFFNRNYVGTHFGGSLYSMCDPFFMLMVLENLGDDYIVWDKEARIRFVRPGRGTVQAHFRVSGEELEALRAAVDRDGTAEQVFSVDVTDEPGRIVARVDKRVYVRRKTPAHEG